ncbi:polysaccharide biosynthesis/export family protein [Synechococcus sp. MIT S9451]|uniref:polysaccharide biosynthesis/export family protein n=1 Tax=Synechococcus sp. MIT S9451 TaxID=3082543 RepID=UPI0039B36E19
MEQLIRPAKRAALLAILASLAFGTPSKSIERRQNPVANEKIERNIISTLASTIPAVAKTPSTSILHNQIRDGYILGPGDALVIELLDIPEYSGTFTIGPDGTLYLPRLRSLFVEGLTIEELRYFLTQQFSSYIKNPEVFVSPVAYRPIRVYIGGEVLRPGYYHLSGQQMVAGSDQVPADTIGLRQQDGNGSIYSVTKQQPGPRIGGTEISPTLRLPTVFDALRTSGGVTPFSNLSEVYVTRKRPLSSGGGKIKAKLNFLALITEGDESQNIRLFDGDTVFVRRSKVELREQIIKAGQTNLSPDYVSVFVTGRVRDSGKKILPQGSSLDQALAAAGGQKLVRGRVEFIRFNRDGTTDRRKFFITGSNPSGSYKNPILMPGDVIRVNDSPLSATITILDEITTPALGIYSIFSLFKDFN